MKQALGFLALCVFYTLFANAQDGVGASKPSAKTAYVDGFTLCSAALTRQTGGWVQTGTFKEEAVFVYTHFINSFQAERPTILYFTGGPGGHSHNLDLQGRIATQLGYNLLAFDHRGVGCSKPRTEAIYLDSDFYSSVNVVTDAKAIIDHFNLKKVSVWGASYGTVPATIFASYYPQSVQAVLLEGVFYQFVTTDHMKKLVDQFWASLSEDAKKKIESYHAYPETKNIPNPVFQVLRDISLNHGQYAQKKFAAHLNSMGSELIVNRDVLLNWVKQNFPKKISMSTVFPQGVAPTDVDVHVYNTLLAKELGRCTRDFNAVFYKVMNGMIVELKQIEDEDATMACDELAARNYISTFNLQEIEKEYIDTENFLIHYEEDISLLYFKNKYYSFGDVPSLYKPEQFSIKAPVYYFNGTYDLATPLDLAQKHYRDVNTIPEQSYFLAFDSLGHHPILESYDMGSQQEIQCMDILIKSALMGLNIKNKMCTAQSLSSFKINVEQ
ncbi:MAG: alpha/beta hydrolase [Bdellovibrionaceae bacterium]|nr:alpha/beta hydrolase [Pseudobdellovibrionaceae bacterium]